MRNRRHKTGRNVAYGTHWTEKKIASSIANLQAANPRKRCLKSASEKPEPQQASSPTDTKPQAHKRPKRCLRNPIKTKKRLRPALQTCKPLTKEKGAWGARPKSPNPSRSPTQAMRNRMHKTETSPTEPTKQKKKPEPQQVSNPSHAKPHAKKRPKRRLRNPQKRKRIKHHLNPSSKRPKTLRNRRHEKGPNVAYGTHKKQRNSLHLRAASPRKKAETSRTASRYPAQAMRNRRHKKGRNVAYGTHWTEKKDCVQHCKLASR